MALTVYATVRCHERRSDNCQRPLKYEWRVRLYHYNFAKIRRWWVSLAKYTQTVKSKIQLRKHLNCTITILLEFKLTIISYITYNHYIFLLLSFTVNNLSANSFSLDKLLTVFVWQDGHELYFDSRIHKIYKCWDSLHFCNQFFIFIIYWPGKLHIASELINKIAER